MEDFNLHMTGDATDGVRIQAGASNGRLDDYDRYGDRESDHRCGALSGPTASFFQAKSPGRKPRAFSRD